VPGEREPLVFSSAFACYLNPPHFDRRKVIAMPKWQTFAATPHDS